MAQQISLDDRLRAVIASLKEKYTDSELQAHIDKTIERMADCLSISSWELQMLMGFEFDPKHPGWRLTVDEIKANVDRVAEKVIARYPKSTASACRSMAASLLMTGKSPVIVDRHELANDPDMAMFAEIDNWEEE